ncbi:MAG: T9SS type A sorting domain-containing protein [Saprospiraceae bacterium]|nr:T9SS type A sorting domain-containing protein [Saprospiraceae bacterium]
MKYIFTLISVLITLVSFGQTNSFWSVNQQKSKPDDSWTVHPQKYTSLHLDFDQIYKTLSAVPDGQKIKINIVNPEGSMELFEIEAIDIFEKNLKLRYQNIRSFYGSHTLRNAEKIALSISPYGCHVMVIKQSGEQYYIDPIYLNQPSENVVYYKQDLQNKAAKRFFCKMPEVSETESSDLIENSKTTESSERTGDCRLRTYRLALACTGEYANFHGGTIEKVLAAYNVGVTRLNLVYRKEIGIFMRLVDNTDKLIFLNASTDPYTNSNTGNMLNQNQTTVDNMIGRSNYDIGHVFGTGDGGIASLGSVCNGNRKAQGVTGRPSPVGDAFFIDYVAHEMGHQFRANHTQNNSCQRNSATAMEPGSASTIMGYAGICAPDVQNNSNDYFHAISLSEMSGFILSQNNCGVIENLGNNRPELTLDKSNYTIPVSTPFVLTGSAVDTDDDEITYTWEQMNNETALMPPRATNTVGPMFRSISPSTSPSRYFPDLTAKYGQWEVLPSVARSMVFRCTARDNSNLGGCTDEANITLQSVTSAGPFNVTLPSLDNVIWQTGGSGSVLWNVANTDKAPINCLFVNIYLSIDGGLTYPYLLAENIPNNGSYEVTVPNLPTTKARIMVKASDNVFFDTSNFPFTIKNIFEIIYADKNKEICSTNVVFPFEVRSLDNNANHRITFELLEAPTGISVTFPDTITQLPFQGQIEVASNFTFDPGEIMLVFNVNNPPYQFKDTLYIYSNGPVESNQFVLNQPTNGTFFPMGTSQVLCSWNEVLNGKYLVQISTHPDFTDSLTSEFVLEKSELLFNTENKLYFIRGKVLSDCGQTHWSETYMFSTDGKTKYTDPLLRNNNLIVNKNQQKLISKLNIDIDYEVRRPFSFRILTTPNEGIITVLKNNQTDTLQAGDLFYLEDIYDELVTYKHQGGSLTFDDMTFFIDNETERSSPYKLEINILQNNEFQAQAELIEDIKCHGENGVIKLWVEGGTPPYRYKILPGNNYIELSDELISLPAGQYQFVIQDSSNNDYFTNRIAVKQPSKLTNQTITSFYDLNIVSTGGAGFSRTYSINGILNDTPTFINVPNGTYITGVTDFNQCTTYDTTEVNIAPLSIDSLIYEDSLLCADDITKVNLTISGGFSPYKITVDSLNTGINLIYLRAGSYDLQITDAGGKTIGQNIVISSNPPLSNQVNVDRREVSWLTTGGVAPYSYSLDGNSFFSFDFLQDLSNGNYSLLVRDSVGCEITSDFKVNILESINLNIDPIKCYGEKSSIRIQPENGTPPFYFGLNKNQMDTISEFKDISAGAYTIYVADAAGDSLEQNINISQPDSLSLGFSVSLDTLILLPSGGTPPFEFSVDNGFTFLPSGTFTGVPKGSYFVLVKDKNGCLADTMVEITYSSVNQYAQDKKPVIYPNPSNDFIRISNFESDFSKKQVYFTDVLGQKITIPNNKDQNIWDIKDLSPGIYYMNIKDSLNTFRLSFIKI